MNLNEDHLRDKHGAKTKELRRKLREKDSILEGYKKTHGKMELFFEEIRSLIPRVAPTPVIYNPKQDYRVKRPVYHVAQITDWHYGAVQDPDEIEGFGVFSPTICEERAIKYAKKLIDRVTLQRHNMRVDELHIIETGDMISGDIHQELTTTNAFPVPEQVVLVSDLLARFIGMLAQHYKKVVVHYLVADNHSRKTRKPQSKQEGLNSENFIIGHYTADMLKEQQNVVFNLYPQYEKVISIANMQYLIMHGHSLRGWMGIPWYSFQRHVGKEATARMSQIMDAPDLVTAAAKIGFHKLITGHFHTPFNHPLYSCSASMSGTDAYDHKDGRHAKPGQSSWFVHPEHGEFDRTDFQL